MFPEFGRESAKIRVESLRGDGGPRRARSPGRLRKALGHGFVGAGERILGDRRERGTLRIGGGA